MKGRLMAAVVLAVVCLAGYWALTPNTVTTSKRVDKNGVTVFVIKLDELSFFDTDTTREKARTALEQTLGKPIDNVSRIQPIRNWTGCLIAYAIWNDR